MDQRTHLRRNRRFREQPVSLFELSVSFVSLAVSISVGKDIIDTLKLKNRNLLEKILYLLNILSEHALYNFIKYSTMFDGLMIPELLAWVIL